MCLLKHAPLLGVRTRGHRGVAQREHVHDLAGVGVQHAHAPAVRLVVGSAEQWRVLDGERVGHLLDAHAGRPSHARRSATVLARTGTEADTGSTLAFLLGPEAARALPGVQRVETLA